MRLSSFSNSGLPENAFYRAGMQVSTRVPGHCHGPGLGRMVELAMAASGSNQIPAVRAQQIEHVPDFHRPILGLLNSSGR
jgi:hypothetical protein